MLAYILYTYGVGESEEKTECEEAKEVGTTHTGHRRPSWEWGGVRSLLKAQWEDKAQFIRAKERSYLYFTKTTEAVAGGTLCSFLVPHLL